MNFNQALIGFLDELAAMVADAKATAQTKTVTWDARSALLANAQLAMQNIHQVQNDLEALP